MTTTKNNIFDAHKNTQTHTQLNTPIPDKPYNASLDVVLQEDVQTNAASTCTVAAASPISSRIGSAASCNRKSANDEYMNDSLEVNVTNKGPIRNNSDGITIEADDNDTIEQDSLETSKVAMSIETNDGGGSGDGKAANGGKSSQFLPFAHIGTNWSNEYGATQQINTALNDDHNCNSSSSNNNTTNPFIEIESTNQTNAFVDVQTNHSSIINNQTSENNYHDIPGI